MKRITRDTSSEGNALDLAAGEEATVLLTDRVNHRSFEEVKLKEGLVVYKSLVPPPVCRLFRATILTSPMLMPPILPGATYELYLHCEEVQCNIRKIYFLNSEDGTAVKKPKCIPGSRTASVQIEVSNVVCIEPFLTCNALGRFALRSRGSTCAVGICVKIL